MGAETTGKVVCQTFSVNFNFNVSYFAFSCVHCIDCVQDQFPFLRLTVEISGGVEAVEQAGIFSRTTAVFPSAGLNC
jgi:hypothetical protein